MNFSRLLQNRKHRLESSRRSRVARPRKHRFESLEDRYLLAAPTLAPIEDMTVHAGSPVHIPLDGFDADGDELSFSVIGGDSNLTTLIPDGNRSMRISVQDHGDMVLELFEQRAPNTTSRIIELAESGFYDGLIFHRVIEDFMIQGGSSDGFGFEGSGETFDDEFHPDLRHGDTGVLSMAKGGPNTNDSQFFITSGPTPHLDDLHNVFGQLTDGEDVRASIAAVETHQITVEMGDPPEEVPVDDVPVTDVVMTSVDIFHDTENGVLMVKAPEGISGETDVTVRVSDGHGGTTQQTFKVTFYDLPEEWADADPIEVTTGTTVTQALPPLDAPGLDVVYSGEMYDGLDGWEDVDFLVGQDDGIVTVTPTNGLVGVQFVSITATIGDDLTEFQQWIPFYINPAAPGPSRLVASADTGISSTDRLTNLNNSDGNALTFRVSGVFVLNHDHDHADEVEDDHDHGDETEDNHMHGTRVTVYADGVEIGQGITETDSIVIQTNGSHVLTDAVHSITAVQTVLGQDIEIRETVDLASDPSQPIEITVDTDGPQFTSQPVVEGSLGEEYYYDVQTDDETAGQPVSYRLAGAPAGMAIDSATGEITWTAQLGDSLAPKVVVAASDPAGNELLHEFNILLADMPHVDFTLLPGEAVDGEYRYAFQAMRTGRLTVEALFAHDAGDVDLALYTPSGVEINRSETRTNHERVDRFVNAGQVFEVVVTGDNPNVRLRMTNLLVDMPGRLVVFGTEGDDTFDIAAGPSQKVTVNGVVYDEFHSVTGQNIDVIGLGGEDTGEITGTEQNDIVMLWPGWATVAGGDYFLTMKGASSVTVNAGGGFDQAAVHGSPGDDKLAVKFKRAILRGDDYISRALQFESIEVCAGPGGTDTADAYDSTYDDTFVGAPAYSEISSDRYFTKMWFFPEVHAVSTEGGFDNVRFYDSPGDDTLVATPTDATLSGDGFSSQTEGFSMVQAFAGKGGIDRAELYDSPGDDFLYGGPLEGAIIGDGFHNRVKSFKEIEAYADAGGNDTAEFYDSIGWDLFTAEPGHAKLSGKRFSMEATSFDNVAAFAYRGGIDTARLTGTAGKDTFSGSLTGGNLSGLGFNARAKMFEVVEVDGLEGGLNVAKLYDSPEDDTLEATPTGAKLSNARSSVTVAEFSEIHAFATMGGEDTAKLQDSPGDDIFKSHPKESWLTGPGFFTRAKFFEHVEATASEGGHDTAYLYDSPQHNTFTGDHESCVASGTVDVTTEVVEEVVTDGVSEFVTTPVTENKPFENRANSFEKVIAFSMPKDHEVANLRDSPGDDLLVAGPNYAVISGDDYSIRLNGFFGVDATSTSGGYNMAKLFDSPGNDTFHTLSHSDQHAEFALGNSFHYIITGFDAVYAYAVYGGDDTAYLDGSNGNDSLFCTPEASTMVRPDFFARVKYFDEVFSDAGEGDDDRAVLRDSDQVNILKAGIEDEWAALSNKVSDDELDLLYSVQGYGNVKAIATTKGDQVISPPLADLLFTLELEGPWQW